MIAYYFRLFKAVLRSLSKEKISLGDESEITWRCLPSEGEDFQTMNASRIINAAEVSCHYNNLRSGFFKCAVKNRLWALTRRYHVEYYRPIFLLKKLNVRSRLIYWNDKAVFWHHRLFQRDTLCAEIYSEVRLRSRHGAVSPFAAQEMMGVHVPSPAAPDKLKRSFELSDERPLLGPVHPQKSLATGD